MFSNASRRDSEDRQTNAKGIPQQSAELSDQIPSVKIGSDGECTMKDTSCLVLAQVHTCDGDIATIIAKRVSYVTVQGVRKLRESTSTLQVRKNREGELRPVQGVRKMRESTSTLQVRKNREGELRPVQVEVREKKCNGNRDRIKAVMLAKSDTTSATTNSRRSRYRAAAILSETNTGPSDALQKISRRSNTVTGSESALQISGGSNNETGSADASQISGGSNDKTGCADALVNSGGSNDRTGSTEVMHDRRSNNTTGSTEVMNGRRSNNMTGSKYASKISGALQISGGSNDKT